MQKIFELWTRFFVLWVVLFSLIAYRVPHLFTPLKPFIVPGLGVIMFGMGMTLTPSDFARVARMPLSVLCGLLGQFFIMPFLAFALARIAGLSSELATGFCILGSCPGGTASNVIAYLAGADVALSVTMTACSTLAAVIMTPVLVKLLAGFWLPVDFWDLLRSVATVVLVPVSMGLVLRYYFGKKAVRFLRAFPALSVTVIVLIVACIVGLSKDQLAKALGPVVLLAVAHNGGGLLLGYLLAWSFGLPLSARRTIAIEVGMQNSGLGVALAKLHFAYHPLVALPSSVFSVVHNVTGSLLASFWRRSSDNEADTGEQRRRGGIGGGPEGTAKPPWALNAGCLH